MAFKMFW